MRTKWMTCVLIGACSFTSLAANRIREWGGHAVTDYRIEQLGVDDVGVVILANTQPELPWKFEAYDSVTDMPGDIEYIRITPEGQPPIFGNPRGTATYLNPRGTATRF